MKQKNIGGNTTQFWLFITRKDFLPSQIPLEGSREAKYSPQPVPEEKDIYLHPSKTTTPRAMRTVHGAIVTVIAEKAVHPSNDLDS